MTTMSPPAGLAFTGLRKRTAKQVTRAVLAQPSGIIGVAIVLVYLLVGLLPGLFSPSDPLTTDAANNLAAPSWGHPLGTDEIGRDVLARLAHATGPALLVGAAAVVMAGGVGIGLGILAGYYRGVVEAVIMRVCDVLFAFPAILIGIFAVVVLGSGILPVALAVGISALPMFARLARAEVLEEMSRDYVRASRGMGGRDGYVVVRHVLPNIAPTMVVQCASAISAAVVLAAALDFIGLGTQPPNPSWGAMLQSSRNYLDIAPMFAISPGLVITIFVLGVNLLAAALTNALDPRIRTKILNAGGGMAGLLFGMRRPKALGTTTAIAASPGLPAPSEQQGDHR